VTAPVRRRARRLRWFAIPMVLAILATACGDDDDDSASTDTTTGASSATTASATTGGAPATTPSTIATPSTEAPLEVDPNGELRVGWDLTAINGINLDPGSSDNITDFQFHDLIYDSPLRVTPAGGLEPSLAEAYDIVDSRTITVELEAGLKYSDGSPLTANDVPPTVTRYQEALGTQKNNLNPSIAQIESIEVTSPTAFTIHLKADIAGEAVQMLANREFVIQPTGQTAEVAESKPIGAGPFMVESFTPGQELVLVKNPNYHAPDEVLLAKIRFIHVDSASIANALKGGQIDLHVNYSANDYAGIKDDSNFTAQILPSDSNFIYMGICKDAGAPYEKKEVRQAIMHGIDRDEVNDGAYDGLGEPMTQYWPEASVYYDAATADLATYDADEAKALLATAGVTAETLRVIVISNIPQHNDAALVIGDQLKDLGLTVEVVPTQDIVGDFFQGKKEPAVLTGWVRPGLQKVTRMFGPNSVANVCNYNDDTVNGLTAKIAAIDPTSAEAVQAWKDLSKHIIDNALFIPLLWEPQIVAFKTDAIAGLSQVYPGREGVNLRGVFVPAT
jgi:peptide/nickel transport system substrate-binding protein